MDVVNNVSCESPKKNSGVAAIIAIIRKYQIGRNGFVPNHYDRDFLKGSSSEIERIAREVAICEAWLNLVKPDPSIREKAMWFSSYLLKHKVEAWTQKSGSGLYVSNAALLIASLLMGVRVRKKGHSNPNGDVMILPEQRWPR
jgi:hypothetical protein